MDQTNEPNIQTKRRWFRWIGIACLTPVALVLLVSILLYIPSFQHFAIRKAAAYASEATGMQIAIEQIRLSFPLDLTLRGIEVLSPPQDTLLMAQEVKVRVQPGPLLHKQVLIESVSLKGVKANTGALIEGMEIKGHLGEFKAKADRISLDQEKATFNNVELSNTALTLILTETETVEEPDTVPVNWLINLEKIALNQVSLALQMPDDSLRMSSYIDKALLWAGSVDLGKERYGATRLSIQGGSLNYDSGNSVPTDGFDPSHIALTHLNTSLSSLRYAGREMAIQVDSLVTDERSGLQILSMNGTLRSDGTTLRAPHLQLKSGNSELQLTAEIPWSSLDEKGTKEHLAVNLIGSIGKEDLLIAAGELPEDFLKAYPNEPLLLTAALTGNMKQLRMDPFVMEIPGAIKMEATGEMEAVLDSLHRSGEMTLSMKAGKLGFLLTLLDAADRERYRIPEGMQLSGLLTLANRQYHTEMVLEQAAGQIRLMGDMDPTAMSYQASLAIDSLIPTYFMPNDSLYWLTAGFEIAGKGVSPFDSATQITLQGQIADIRFGTASASDIRLDGSLKNHLLQMDLLSRYPLAQMDLSLNASLYEKDIKAMLIADVTHADLHRMNFVEKPLSTSFQLFAEVESDMGDNNKVDITLGNWEIETGKALFRPKILTLQALSDPDTTRVSFHAGDLGIVLTGNACVHELGDKFTRISDDITRQFMQDSMVNLNLLRPLLPDMHLKMTAGQDNPIYNYLQNYYIDFEQMALDAYASPTEGMRMEASVYQLARDTMQLDTLRAEIFQDSLGLIYNAQVIKNRYRKQKPFSAGLQGAFRYGYGDARLSLKDGKGETGLLLGIRADKIEQGVKLRLFPNNPIIAFRPFTLNEDNHITLHNAKDIAADLRLTGKENASLWIHSEEGDAEAEEVHVELSQINLNVLSNAVSYLPELQGILNADLKYVPSDSAFMVVGDMSIDELFYEQERVGELQFNAVYLPLERGNHQVDMHLMHDRKEISNITALYQAAADEQPDRIEGAIAFTHLPLAMLNPFIPEDMAKLRGDLDGELTIEGSSDAPQSNGYLKLDTASVYIGAAGSTFRFDEKEVKVKNNRMLFDQYQLFAYGKNPFLLDGEVNFNNLSRMTANLKMKASNLQLLNVKRNSESLVYGKLFVNLNSTLKGPLEALTMRGDLQLLGGTNMTYILQDSPLTVQDRLSDMVSFTSFADTVRRKMPRKPPLPLGGMDMLMTIRIDPAVQMSVDLTPDQSSHVNLEGGGDLSFQYTPQGDMFLNGRYTLTGGKVKYSMPVIPLKEFSIQEGSYVQWTGDPMDPMLNLTATERVRSSVNIQGSPRSVNFDVGIELKQRLENLGLNFTLSAPEDMAMQDELNAKGPEERAKLAVSMLVTGMYLGNSSNGKVNVNMGDALSNFLQSEINNIAGSALKTVDISFGMETYDENSDKGGGSRTDYSFRFAKRFYNDRIRVVLGGRISTGENINNGQAQPFIDNVSVEYRLDNSGSRYIKLFHNKNYESLLEGEIIETGAGVVLRKKMMHLRELFNFRKKKVAPVNEDKEDKEE